MPFTSLTGGLNLTVPTNGTENWGTTVLNATWTPISNHNHTGSGNGNQIATAALEDQSVTSAKLANNISVNAIATTLTPSGTTETIDWANGTIQVIDLGSATGDVTLTLSNPIAGAIYYVKVIQGATPRDLIYPATVKWPQAQKALLSQAVGEEDLITLLYDGTNYLSDWQVDYS